MYADSAKVLVGRSICESPAQIQVDQVSATFPHSSQVQ